MSGCECYARSVCPMRAQMWERIFPPDGKVPIKSPLPSGMGIFPDGDEWQNKVKDEFYLVDLDRVSPEQKERLVQEMCSKFNLPREEVIADIDEKGVPIKGVDIMVHWCRIHTVSLI